MEQINKYRIYVRTHSSDLFDSGYAFIGSGNSYLESPENDMFITVSLQRTSSINDYVIVRKHNESESIQRQEINPFFYEYSLFDSISRNRINSGNDLSSRMIDFIKSIFPQFIDYTNQQVRDWFDYEGMNLLPWTTANGSSIDLRQILDSHPDLSTVASRASSYNIDIYTINANT